MRFKKGEKKEWFQVLMFDLGCLELKDTEDNKYRYNLVIANLENLFKMKLCDLEF